MAACQRRQRWPAASAAAAGRRLLLRLEVGEEGLHRERRHVLRRLELEGVARRHELRQRHPKGAAQPRSGLLHR